MIKTFSILVTTCLSFGNSYSQKKESITIGYNNSNTAYHVDKKEVQQGFRRIVLYGQLDDTVSVYLNNNRIVHNFFQTPKGSTTDRVFDIPIKVDSGVFYFLKIYLSKANEYTEFPLDMRYAFVNAYYIKGEFNSVWRLIFSNEFPKE